MRIVDVTGRNDSNKSADPKNGVRLTMSDLLKSVKMPKIILERSVGHKLDVSVDNSNQTKCETLLKKEEFSVHSCFTKSPEDGKLIKCFYCDKTFTQECHRTLHHKTHTEDKLYTSPKQKFVHRRNRKIGEVTRLGKKLVYKCFYCEKGFAAPSALQTHEKIHTGEKPFKCSFCNNRFNTPSNLKCHERTHTGEKPFKCSFCNNRFKEAGAAKRHERTHTGEKPFKCSFCNNRFNDPGAVKRHERTHTGEKPFKCSFCNNRFNNSCAVKRHEITHTGEKPYKCSFCNKRFKRRIHLKLHERTHTGEKPFKNSHQNDHREQVPSLISQVSTQQEGCLVHLKQEDQMHSTGATEFKCSFCEMTFSHDEERANHEKIHKREDEIATENLIIGI